MFLRIMAHGGPLGPMRKTLPWHLSGGQQVSYMALRDAELRLTSQTATLRNGNALSAVKVNYSLSNIIPSVHCGGY